MSVWTDPANVEKLKALYGKGKSAAEIAVAIGGGISRMAVIGKAKRLGLSLAAVPSAPRLARPKPQPKPAPRLTVKANQQVFREPDARPILTPAKANAFVQLPGTTPRPFFERPPGGCKWPIGEGADMRSCCATAERGGYCEPHAAMAFSVPKPGAPRTGNELARSLRRYVER